MMSQGNGHCLFCGERLPRNRECVGCKPPSEHQATYVPVDDATFAEDALHQYESLKKHPRQEPWRLFIKNEECKSVSARAINYDEIVKNGIHLHFSCSANEDSLDVRSKMEVNTGKIPLTIRGHRCTQGRLRPGDLLTVGPYAWIFHAYAQGVGYGLEAANPLAGCSVELSNVTVGKRLDVEHLRIEAGEFVGVVGSSGSGKSTLIREIGEKRAGRGKVWIGGRNRDAEEDPAVELVAYVPQGDVVHDDLTVDQQTRDYVRLVDPKASDEHVNKAMQTVGLRDVGSRYPSELSGGQLRRSRLAAALGRRPGVLLLDEPDSGLDPVTALDVRRLLRTFSLLGATVIVVTHHRQAMDQFNRLLELDAGRIVKDSGSTVRPRRSDVVHAGYAVPSGRGQFMQILHREWLQFRQRRFLSTTLRLQWLPRWDGKTFPIPQWVLVLLVPVLFGLAIGFASPIEPLQPDLVGFLCVLSVIWIAASHSHLSLTHGWHRARFEQQQGLRTYPYLAAKSVFLALTAFVQTCGLMAGLWATRYYILREPIFFGDELDQAGAHSEVLGGVHYNELDSNLLWILLVLLLVSVAASPIGLLISALARARVLVATSILPLVMMTQILFSPFVVRADKSDRALEETYTGFWIEQDCEGLKGCPSRAVRPHEASGFVCPDCEIDLSYGDRTLTQQKRDYRTEANELVSPRMATVASYATLTRYADIALRPLVKRQATEEHRQEYMYQDLRYSASYTILGIALGCHALVALLMGCLSFGRFRRFMRGSIASLRGSMPLLHRRDKAMPSPTSTPGATSESPSAISQNRHQRFAPLSWGKRRSQHDSLE